MELFKIFGTIALNGVDDVNEQLDQTTQSAEQSASKLSKVGGFLKSVGKGILLATGAVVTGAVGLVKKVSASYGELQQSIGGVETLYGESAQKVIENANNAFKTAGISANEYMQQVTSFTASLLQSLDGDTAKTADVADMAVRDMADNANKFGTSMEAIQNAYQGFSKQNYTMLDNLKLGYGGTKTEMERLLKDAEKISGIKYDISSLSDVYNAIHVIQQELGVTGTTALEAGETIQGSFNSLGSAWQNFLAGLGDPNADMKQLVENLAQGINGAVTNVIPVINNMVEVLPTALDSIINAISSMLPTLIQTFTEVIKKVIDAIVALLPEFIPLAIDCILTVTQALLENLPLIVDAGIQLILGLAQGISDALPTLVPIIITVIEQIINSLLENIDLIIEIGIELVLALINGILQARDQLVEVIPRLVSTLIETLISNLPLILECGLKLAITLTQGMISYIPKMISYIPKLIMSIVNGLLSGIGQIFGVGDALVGENGLLGGIKKAFNKVVNFFSSAWNNLFSFISAPFNKAVEFIKGKFNQFVGFFSDIINSVKEGWNNFVNFLKNAIKLPHFNISGSWNPLDWGSNPPKIGVEWYAKGGVMSKPTVFGVNPSSGNAMVGGESGAEAIAPISTLQGYVSEAVKAETNNLSYSLEKLIAMLSEYLPNIINNMDREIVLDSGALVGSTAEKMDVKLGSIANSKSRFGV